MHEVALQRRIAGCIPYRKTVGSIIIHIDTIQGADKQPVVGGQGQTGKELMREIGVDIQFLLIGVKLEQAMIGCNPYNIITLYHIRDIQTIESAELR